MQRKLYAFGYFGMGGTCTLCVYTPYPVFLISHFRAVILPSDKPLTRAKRMNSTQAWWRENKGKREGVDGYSFSLEVHSLPRSTTLKNSFCFCLLLLLFFFAFLYVGKRMKRSPPRTPQAKKHFSFAEGWEGEKSWRKKRRLFFSPLQNTRKKNRSQK